MAHLKEHLWLRYQCQVREPSRANLFARVGRAQGLTRIRTDMVHPRERVMFHMTTGALVLHELSNTWFVNFTTYIRL